MSELTLEQKRERRERTQAGVKVAAEVMNIAAAYAAADTDNAYDYNKEVDILTFAASGAAAGAAFSGLGAGIGAVVGIVAGAFIGDKKAEALKKKYDADLKAYQSELKKFKRGVQTSLEQTGERGRKIRKSIVDETQKSLISLNKLSSAQALGVTDVSTKRQIKEEAEAGVSAIETSYEITQDKISKYKELQAAIDSEINTDRAFGTIRTDKANRIDELLDELA